jgi:hypothetical protein
MRCGVRLRWGCFPKGDTSPMPQLPPQLSAVIRDPTRLIRQSASGLATRSCALALMGA